MIFELELPKHQRTAIRNVAEVFLYPSFGVPYCESEVSRRGNEGVCLATYVHRPMKQASPVYEPMFVWR